MRRCQEHLPGFPLAYIGWSLPYATELLKYDNIHFNLLQRILVGPCGARFVRAAHARGRNVFVWTVNAERWMDWSIRSRVDGVITDDPRLYLDVCRRHEAEDGGGDDDDDSGGGGGGPGGGGPRLLRRGGERLELEGRRRRVARWLKMYTGVVIIQLLVWVYVTLVRIPLGSERRRVQKAMRR